MKTILVGLACIIVFVLSAIRGYQKAESDFRACIDPILSGVECYHEKQDPGVSEAKKRAEVAQVTIIPSPEPTIIPTAVLTPVMTTKVVWCSEAVKDNLSLTIQEANNGVWPGVISPSGMGFLVARYDAQKKLVDSVITLQSGIVDNVAMNGASYACFSVNSSLLETYKGEEE